MKVLVVEEHGPRAESMLRDLRRQGYDADNVDTGSAALKLHREADLILLDLELPDIDGLEVCRAIRAVSGTPIISFTGRDAELDRVLALQAGSDDCVLKSCGPREIMARIKAVLRRVYGRSASPQSISLCALEIDGRAREVRLNDQAVNVTAKEFDLLYALASHPERVISRKDLMTLVWDAEAIASSRTIDTHVSSLRAKLGASEWIITVRGVGYRIGYGPTAATKDSCPPNGSAAPESRSSLTHRLRQFDLAGAHLPSS